MAKEFTPGQRALDDLVILLRPLDAGQLKIVHGWVGKIRSELDAAAGLLAALEVLAAEPSDDWRDATDDPDGHMRTPRQRAIKQANTAIAKAKGTDP